MKNEITYTETNGINYPNLALPPQLTWVGPLVRFACFHTVSAPRHLLPDYFLSTVSACSAFVCGKNCGQTAF